MIHTSQIPSTSCTPVSQKPSNFQLNQFDEKNIDPDSEQHGKRLKTNFEQIINHQDRNKFRSSTYINAEQSIISKSPSQMTKSEQMKMYWERKKKAQLLTDGNKDNPHLGVNKFNSDSQINSEIKLKRTPKTPAERSKKYRERKKKEKGACINTSISQILPSCVHEADQLISDSDSNTQIKSKPRPKTSAERTRKFRERKKKEKEKEKEKEENIMPFENPTPCSNESISQFLPPSLNEVHQNGDSDTSTQIIVIGEKTPTYR